MLCEGLPEGLFAGDDVQFEARFSGAFGCDLSGGHVEDPVGGQPRDDVIVAGNGDELTLEVAGPDRLGDGGGSDTSHGAVDDAGEFVEDDGFGIGIEQSSREIRAELFAC